MRRQRRRRKLRCILAVSVMVPLVILLRLLYATGVFRGWNLTADESADHAADKAWMESITRGTVIDREGRVICSSEGPGREAVYADDEAFSKTLGFLSPKFGSFGLMGQKDYADLLFGTEKGGIGATLELTFDRELTTAVYGILRENQIEGTVIITDIKGRILAAAQSPSFDVNHLEEKWSEINQTEGMLFTGLLTPKTPGSVGKLLTSVGILENREELPVKDYDDQGGFYTEFVHINNAGHEKYGKIGYEEALGNSVNSYFADMALRLGKEKMDSLAARFRLTETIPTDFGIMKANWDIPKDNDYELAASGIGQGRFMMSEYMMSAILISIAGGGPMYLPYAVHEAVDSQGTVLYEGKPRILAVPMDKETAAEITRGMEEAAEKTGLSTIDGQRVAMKTGTAQIDIKTGMNNIYMASFYPSQSPRYIVVISKYQTTENSAALRDVTKEIYSLLECG